MAAPVRQTSFPWWTLVSASVAKPCSIIERMKPSSCGSTAHSSVSAHQSASSCGLMQSTAIWMFSVMGRTYDAAARTGRVQAAPAGSKQRGVT